MTTMTTMTPMTIGRINADIKGEIADKIVYQASPGYCKRAQGEWYTDGVRLYHVEEMAQWMPWADGTETVAVDELIDGSVDADPTPSGELVAQYGQEAAEEMARDAACLFVYDEVAATW